jgi:hypothetical protein
MAYQTIKEIGRKYLAPVILAGTLALTGCDKKSRGNSDLPIYEGVKTKLIEEQDVEMQRLEQERRKSLEDLAVKYNSELESARETFNQGIIDRDLTKGEQQAVFEKYKSASELSSKIISLSKKYRFTEYSQNSLPEPDKRLYGLLNKNLNMADYGRPELHYYLKNQGLKVNVEAVDNIQDFLGVCTILWAGVGGSCLTVLGIGGAGKLIKKIRGR